MTSGSVRDNPPQVSTPGERRAAPYAVKTRDYYRALSASSVGIELAVSVLIGLFFGRWLDGRIGTAPWMMILFLCFGFAAGLRSIYRFVLQADRDAARAEAEAKADAANAAATAAGNVADHGKSAGSLAP